MTGQTYAERAITDTPVDTPTNLSGALLRVDGELIALDNFATFLASIMGTVNQNAIDNTLSGGSGLSVLSTLDNQHALYVQSSDTSPSVPPFRVDRSDFEIFASIHSSWVAGAIGFINAVNVFDAKVWVTSDQTEPAGASNGQYWIRPRVA